MNIAKLNQKVFVVHNVRGSKPTPGKVVDVQRNGKTLIVRYQYPAGGVFFIGFTLRTDGIYRERTIDRCPGRPAKSLKIRNT